MIRLLALSAALVGLASASMAGDHAGHDMAEMSDAGEALPAACDAASKPAETMGNMSGMAPDAAASAMNAMQAGMARAATIADPDLAFNCGMIAHHRGAIAMAETELERGRDAASKSMATAIIAAQKREIAFMTARVEALAK